jgi:S1-C subfamily serine protease
MAVFDGRLRGMQVTRVYPGSAAERAGLQVGDFIRSANGYATQVHGNLTWIISNLPANGVLQMSVRTARDGGGAHDQRPDPVNRR